MNNENMNSVNNEKKIVNNKKKIIMLVVLIVGVVLCGCFFYNIYFLNASKDENIKDNVNVNNSKHNNDNTDVLDENIDKNNEEEILKDIEVPDYIKKLSSYIPASLSYFVTCENRTVFNFSSADIVKMGLYQIEKESKEITNTTNNNLEYIWYGNITVDLKPGEKAMVDVYPINNLLNTIDSMFGKNVINRNNLPASISFTDGKRNSDIFVLVGDYYLRQQAQVGGGEINTKAIYAYKEENNQLFIYYNVKGLIDNHSTFKIIKVKETFEKDSNNNYIWKKLECVNEL